MKKILLGVILLLPSFVMSSVIKEKEDDNLESLRSQLQLVQRDLAEKLKGFSPSLQKVQVGKHVYVVEEDNFIQIKSALESDKHIVFSLNTLRNRRRGLFSEEQYVNLWNLSDAMDVPLSRFLFISSPEIMELQQKVSSLKIQKAFRKAKKRRAKKNRREFIEFLKGCSPRSQWPDYPHSKYDLAKIERELNIPYSQRGISFWSKRSDYKKNLEALENLLGGDSEHSQKDRYAIMRLMHAIEKYENENMDRRYRKFIPQ